jgi:hypothetical protein
MSKDKSKRKLRVSREQELVELYNHLRVIIEEKEQLLAEALSLKSFVESQLDLYRSSVESINLLKTRLLEAISQKLIGLANMDANVDALIDAYNDRISSQKALIEDNAVLQRVLNDIEENRLSIDSVSEQFNNLLEIGKGIVEVNPTNSLEK